MKILQVIHGYPMRYNAGSEIHTQILCHALAGRHEVHVFTREEDPFAPDFRMRIERDPDHAGTTLHVVNNPRNRDRYREPGIDRRFAEVLDRIRPDVVVELHQPLRSEFAVLSDDMMNFWRTQAICAAVELGVFEALPATSGEVARSRGWWRRWMASGARRGGAGIWRPGTPEPSRTPPVSTAASSRKDGRPRPKPCAAPAGLPRTSSATSPPIPTARRPTPRMPASYAFHDYPAVDDRC